MPNFDLKTFNQYASKIVKLSLVLLIALNALPVGHLLLDEKLRLRFYKMYNDPIKVFQSEKKAIRFTVHLWLSVMTMTISVTTLALLVVHKRTPAYVLAFCGFLNLIISTVILVFIADKSFQAWYFEHVTGIADKLLSEDEDASESQKDKMCKNIHAMLSSLSNKGSSESAKKMLWQFK